MRLNLWPGEQPTELEADRRLVDGQLAETRVRTAGSGRASLVMTIQAAGLGDLDDLTHVGSLDRPRLRPVIMPSTA
jgi:hypothetical protein